MVYDQSMEKFPSIKSIGDFVSNILLGSTKEIIVRTDERVQTLLKTFTEKIEPDLKNVRERFAVVEDRVETIWQDKFAPAHSPRQLNEIGRKILDESGIKGILENKKDKLLEVVRSQNPNNPYDAEQAILLAVSEISKHCPEVIEDIKTGAFRVGQNIDTVLLVGGIYFRDLIFPELGFSLTDLDKPKTPSLG